MICVDTIHIWKKSQSLDNFCWHFLHIKNFPPLDDLCWHFLETGWSEVDLAAQVLNWVWKWNLHLPYWKSDFGSRDAYLDFEKLFPKYLFKYFCKGSDLRCVSIGRILRKRRKIWFRDTMYINWPMSAKVVPGWVKLEGIFWPEWLSSSSSSPAASSSATSASSLSSSAPSAPLHYARSNEN